MRLHRSGILALAGALLLGLAACGSDSDSGGSSSDACGDIKVTEVDGFEGVKSDTLTVVTSLPGPGFWVGSATDPNQIKSGYEYCMAKALQEATGSKNLVVRNESFDAIVAGTVTDYDIVLSQTTITEDRKKVVDFTEPYFESQQGVLIKTGGPAVTNLEEAKKIKWGVQTGTTAIDLLEKIKPDSEPQVYPQLADAYTALEAGQVDAVLIDTAINLGQAAQSGGKQEVVSQFAQESGPDQYGAILPKGSANKALFDKVIAELKSNGMLTQFAEKNLTKDPGTLPTIQVP